MSNSGRRGAGGLPDVPPGCLEGLIREARHRMIILIILVILQSSYLLFAPVPVHRRNWKAPDVAPRDPFRKLLT